MNTGDEKLDALLKLIDMDKLLKLRSDAMCNMSVTAYIQDVGLILGFPVKILIDIDCRNNE